MHALPPPKNVILSKSHIKFSQHPEAKTPNKTKSSQIRINARNLRLHHFIPQRLQPPFRPPLIRIIAPYFAVIVAPHDVYRDVGVFGDGKVCEGLVRDGVQGGGEGEEGGFTGSVWFGKEEGMGMGMVR
jgi:hypothetical protein